MMCVCCVPDVNYCIKSIFFKRIAKLTCTLPAPLSPVFPEMKNNFISLIWLLNIWRLNSESKTSGTLDQCLSMGLGLLNGAGVGSATSIRVTPRCYTEWGWIKSLQTDWELARGRVNCFDPHQEARPHLPAKTTPPKKIVCISRTLTESLQERFR